MRVKLEEICKRIYAGGDVPKNRYSVERTGKYNIPIYANAEKDMGLYGYTDEAREFDVAVTVAARGTIGFAAIRNEPFLPVVRLITIVPELEKVTPQYLLYALKNYKPKSSGTSIPQLTVPEIKRYSFNLVGLNEQKRISGILDKLFNIVEKRNIELLEYDKLIKARFVEMFGDINTNDRKWEYEPLGNLCTIVRGSSPRPIEKFLGGDIPWIKIGDATDGEYIFLNSTKEHIIQDGVKKSRLVKSGSLIFANCGVSLGFARIITFDGCIHDGWLAMEDIDERLDKIFLLQSLNQMTEHFRDIAPAGTQPNLNTTIMKAYKQVIPPIDLQKKFISFMEQVDKSKVVVQKALDETQTLFDSLMQEYFG